MFVTENQIFVFFACVAFGGCAGVLFSIASGIKYALNNRILGAVADISAFIVCTLFYIEFAFLMRFPSFRIYMTAGVIIGIALYMKSFHIILAKPTKKLYNKIVNCFEKRKREFLSRTEDGKDDGNRKRRKYNRKRRIRYRRKGRVGRKV